MLLNNSIQSADDERDYPAADAGSHSEEKHN